MDKQLSVSEGSALPILVYNHTAEKFIVFEVEYTATMSGTFE
jgi:hypothetical protein